MKTLLEKFKEHGGQLISFDPPRKEIIVTMRNQKGRDSIERNCPDYNFQPIAGTFILVGKFIEGAGFDLNKVTDLIAEIELVINPAPHSEFIYEVSPRPAG